MGEKGIEPLRLKNHPSFTDWYYVANSRHSPIWVVEELNLSLPVKSRVHKTDLPTTQIIWINIKLSRFWERSDPSTT